MIKLYGSGASRWVRPYWTLNELGVPFEAVTVSIRKGENRTPEFLELNPFAKLPALDDNGFHLFESAAICNYLGDKYPEKGLIPRAGTQERALHDQWVSFVISDLEQPLWRVTKHTFIIPEDKRSAADIELAKSDFETLLKVLEKKMNGDYLVGNKFSIADIMMTYTLGWALSFKMLSGYPKLEAYRAKHQSRPQFPAQLFA